MYGQVCIINESNQEILEVLNFDKLDGFKLYKEQGPKVSVTVKAGEAKAVLLQRVDLEKASFHFSAAMNTSGGKGGFGGMGAKGAFAQLGVPPNMIAHPKTNSRSPARPGFGTNKASPAKATLAGRGVARASPARGGVKKVPPKKNIIKGKQLFISE